MVFLSENHNIMLMISSGSHEQKMVWCSNILKKNYFWESLPGKKAGFLFSEAGPETQGYLWQKFITVGLNVECY